MKNETRHKPRLLIWTIAWLVFFIAGFLICLNGWTAPLHELGHILKSAEFGGKVIRLEWTQVWLTEVNFSVLMNGYWFELMSVGIVMIFLFAIGFRYGWRWPVWAFLFGHMHATAWNGIYSLDIYNAAMLYGKSSAEIVGFWIALSAGILIVSWIFIVSIRIVLRKFKVNLTVSLKPRIIRLPPNRRLPTRSPSITKAFRTINI
jgi:hypothetical protein